MRTMHDPPVGRFDAPISYPDIQVAYNTMRALGGALIAATGLMVDPWPGSVMLVAGAILLVDGWYRRLHGSSALPLLLIDVTAMGALILGQPHADASGLVGLVYVVTASFLLLSLKRATSVMAYAGAWVTAVIVMTLTSAGFATGPAAIEEVATIAALLAIIVQLLVSTGRALHAATNSQREALETERRASQLKNEFVSMVSHELRTPLTSISGFTQTLRESWPNLSPDEIDEFLLIMGDETNHLHNLVEDILVIPRLEAGHLRLEPRELDAREESFATAQTVFQASEKQVSVSIPGGVYLNADPVRLKQILRNLLENARKYGGDQILIEGEARGDFFEIAVSDNGPGVPEQDRERIFDHFEQLTKGDARAEGGFGLGLPIARKLATAMGGDLWFEPRFPTGSRFCLTVDLSRIAEPESDAVMAPVTSETSAA